jgi:hypothetical protein
MLLTFWYINHKKSKEKNAFVLQSFLGDGLDWLFVYLDCDSFLMSTDEWSIVVHRQLSFYSDCQATSICCYSVMLYT